MTPIALAPPTSGRTSRNRRLLAAAVALLLLVAAGVTTLLSTGVLKAWAADTGVLNVKTGYGAAGDCSTNDTTAIANAVTALNAGTSGELYFPAGCYMVDGDGTASHGVVSVGISNVIVRGDGIGRTTIMLRSSQTASVTGVLRTKSGTPVSHVTFKDLTVDGNKSGIGVGKASTCFFAGVTAQSASTDEDIQFKNVEAQNCSDYGVDLSERVTRGVVDHVVTHDTDGDGILLSGAYSTTVSNSSSYSNARHGINLTTGSADITISRNDLHDNTQDGVMVQNGAKRVTIDSNEISDTGTIGVQVNGWPQSSPELDTTPTTAVTISNNVIERCNTHGVQIYGASQNIVIGNEIRDVSLGGSNSSNGVYLAEPSIPSGYFALDNLVVGNHIESPTTGSRMKYGVREQSTSENNNFVDGNRITGAQTANYSLQGTTSLSISSSARNPS